MVIYRRARDLVPGDIILNGSQSWMVNQVSERFSARNGSYQRLIAVTMNFGRDAREREFVVNDMVPVEV
jgi:ribosomal protein L17